MQPSPAPAPRPKRPHPLPWRRARRVTNTRGGVGNLANGSNKRQDCQREEEGNKGATLLEQPANDPPHRQFVEVTANIGLCDSGIGLVVEALLDNQGNSMPDVQRLRNSATSHKDAWSNWQESIQNRLEQK